MAITSRKCHAKLHSYHCHGQALGFQHDFILSWLGDEFTKKLRLNRKKETGTECVTRWIFRNFCRLLQQINPEQRVGIGDDFDTYPWFTVETPVQ
jgi:hypothetical protein